MSGELRRVQINDINRDLFKDLIVNEFITCSKITGMQNVFLKLIELEQKQHRTWTTKIFKNFKTNF